MSSKKSFTLEFLGLDDKLYSEKDYDLSIAQAGLRYTASIAGDYNVAISEETFDKLSWLIYRIGQGHIQPNETGGNIILVEAVQLPRKQNVAPSTILKPIINDIQLFGMVDRTLSEMKYIVDHPGDFDSATFQTMKHHLEDMDLFVKHATGKLTKLGVIKSLPPVAEQKERGY